MLPSRGSNFLDERVGLSDKSPDNPYSSPHGVGLEAHTFSPGAKWTWILLCFNGASLLLFLILGTFHLDVSGGSLSDLPAAFLVQWIAIGLPLSSIAVAVFCFTRDRGTRFVWLRLVMSAFVLLAWCAFAYALISAMARL